MPRQEGGREVTKDEHRTWHKKHMAYLNRLIVDFTHHIRPSPIVQLGEFRNWCFEQTITPTETREEASDG